MYAVYGLSHHVEEQLPSLLTPSGFIFVEGLLVA